MDCEILLGGQAIGKAKIEKHGLYYHFDCRCELTGELVYRLQAGKGSQWENLGILVPENGAFCLRTRIPIKRLPQGPLQIQAVPCHEKISGMFVPIYPEEPFRYLQRLENAYLQTRDGQIGVILAQ